MCHNAYKNGYVHQVIQNCLIPATVLSSGSYEESYFNSHTRFGAAEFGHSLMSFVNASSSRTIYIMTVRNPVSDSLFSDYCLSC